MDGMGWIEWKSPRGVRYIVAYAAKSEHFTPLITEIDDMSLKGWWQGVRVDAD